MLKSFSRLSLKLTLEGGHIMNYRIEERGAFRLLGFRRRFTGTPADRMEQEKDFFTETRLGQFLLMGMAHDAVTQYGVMTNFGEDGYDFCIAGAVPDDLIDAYRSAEYVGEELADRLGLEPIEIPAGLWLVCETERCQYPVTKHIPLRQEAVTNWLPDSGYELRDGPELQISHWYNDDRYLKRYVEIWLPVRKI